MDTLTLFINKIYEENLGLDHYQSLENISVCDYNFNKLTISGAFFKNVEFKNINFENCIFWASHFKNVTFTNCQFINCNFQFSHLSNCNFKESCFQNCNWGLAHVRETTSFQNSSVVKNNFFESTLPHFSILFENLAIAS